MPGKSCFVGGVVVVILLDRWLCRQVRQDQLLDDNSARAGAFPGTRAGHESGRGEGAPHDRTVRNVQLDRWPQVEHHRLHQHDDVPPVV